MIPRETSVTFDKQLGTCTGALGAPQLSVRACVSVCVCVCVCVCVVAQKVQPGAEDLSSL